MGAEYWVLIGLVVVVVLAGVFVLWNQKVRRETYFALFRTKPFRHKRHYPLSEKARERTIGDLTELLNEWKAIGLQLENLRFVAPHVIDLQEAGCLTAENMIANLEKELKRAQGFDEEYKVVPITKGKDSSSDSDTHERSM